MTPNVVVIPVPFIDHEESFFDLTVDSSQSTTGTGAAATFYVVTGPIIRQIKALYFNTKSYRHSRCGCRA
ncbi:hypothetical protein L484_000722 [Morus notabilis]|uniref:Uncharacterized protein n=1 Tax=Morus notabilis TaxID=981085 RepID=W9S039_9ROSA|nr:hypothetical protein L484_000722 [Morus notabilis]